MSDDLEELVARATPLLECEHRTNRPNERGDGGRVVGFVLDRHDIVGLSEPLFALEALVELARIAALRAHQERKEGE